jgi:hypothetical protein
MAPHPPKTNARGVGPYQQVEHKRAACVLRQDLRAGGGDGVDGGRHNGGGLRDGALCRGARLLGPFQDDLRVDALSRQEPLRLAQPILRTPKSNFNNLSKKGAQGAEREGGWEEGG